jgi:hypothetical protein
MNYFAHAHVAASLGNPDAALLGAMLPDFAQMIGVRIAGLRHPALAAGAALHHRTDAAFHASPSFRGLVREGVQALVQARVARGPARGAAHVGVELLLDAALAGSEVADARYLGALRLAPALEGEIRWREECGHPRWKTLQTRLLGAGPPAPCPAPAQLAERIGRVLESRPRLRLDPGERAALADWVAWAAPVVARQAAPMLEETLAGVERAAPTPGCG